MAILKKAVKSLASLLLIVLFLAVLFIVGLNVAKFVIYSDYYAIESSLCKNPGLSDGFVCQGIAAVDGQDRILVSGYMKGGEGSRVYVTDLEDRSYYVLLHRDGVPFTGHAGGIAVTGDTVYIASEGRVYTLPLSFILNANNGDGVNIGQGTEVNNKASFIYTDDELVYVGSFAYPEKGYEGKHEFNTAEGTHVAICSAYKPDDLSVPVCVYTIRQKVQGICFTPDGKVVMATSYGLADSVYYVYDLDLAANSGLTLDGAPVYYLDCAEKEVKGPAMAEGLDYFGGKVITLTESASDKYIYGKLFFAYDIVSLDLE